MKKKRVLIISKKDHAGLGYRMSESLKSVGIESYHTAYFEKYKIFSFPCNICSMESLVKMIKLYDIIQFMHSEYIDTPFLKDKKVCVHHGGSRYRNKHKQINEDLNGKVDLHIIQTADLWGLGAYPEEWILPPIDTEDLKPNYIAHEKKLIYHSPSSPRLKGSQKFNNLMAELKKDLKYKKRFNYVIDEMRKPWRHNIKSISECDIYFDACMPKIEGRPYGFWGLAALEAAALGKVVITHFCHMEKEYREQYGEHNLKVANDFEQVEHQVINLIMMDDDELLYEQQKTRKWIEDIHSMKAIGQRLVNTYRKYNML